MSLINKMLQDLDARGGSADGGLRQQQLHAVEIQPEGSSKLRLAVLALGVAVLAGAGGYGWHYWQGQRLAHAVGIAAALQPAATPAAAAAPVVAAVVAPAATPVAATAPMAPPEPAAALAPAAATPPVAAPAAPLARSGNSKAAAAAAPAVTVAVVTAPAVASVDTVPLKAASARKTAGNVSRSNDEMGEAGTITHNLSPKLMAENTYRRGLVALQEGRVHAALTDFERALEIDPRNEAARQTYISLLLENKRNDDAMRQLRLALGIDPRQPGLAMILARLQLEKGGPALQTLMTTLPFAGSNPEYHAFLAGVLQREQRHAEAAQHYRDALQLTPQNGVWWMGLGISLQADNHPAEAGEAFRRARAASGLSAELQTFIDRKLDALAR